MNLWARGWATQAEEKREKLPAKNNKNAAGMARREEEELRRSGNCAEMKQCQLAADFEADAAASFRISASLRPACAMRSSTTGAEICWYFSAADT